MFCFSCFDRTVQYTISLPIQKQIRFSVMVYRHKYTWCKIYKKKKTRQVYWVSCIKILDYRGSKLEAQMTLGHFYLVHHSNLHTTSLLKLNEHYITEYYCHIYFLSKITVITSTSRPITKSASEKDT